MATQQNKFPFLGDESTGDPWTIHQIDTDPAGRIDNEYPVGDSHGDGFIVNPTGGDTSWSVAAQAPICNMTHADTIEDRIVKYEILSIE